jgi:hypothetical protein
MRPTSNGYARASRVLDHFNGIMRIKSVPNRQEHSHRSGDASPFGKAMVVLASVSFMTKVGICGFYQ